MDTGEEEGFTLGLGVSCINGAGLGVGVGAEGAAVGMVVGSWSGQSNSSCIVHVPLPVNWRTHPPPAPAESSTVKAPRSRSWFSMLIYLVVDIVESASTATKQHMEFTCDFW